MVQPSSSPGDFSGSLPALPELLALFSAHRVGIWSYETHSGALRFINDYFPALGLDRAGIRFDDREGLLGTLHPDDRAAYGAAFEAASGLCGAQPPLRYRRMGAGGEVCWLEEHLFADTPGEQGRPRRILGFTTSAAEVTGLQQQVEAVEQKYKKLVNTLPDFIFVFDENFVFQDIIMPEGMSLLHSREELLGTSGRMIFTPEVSELYEANIRDCLQTGQMKEIEYYLLIGDIKYYFQARIVPFEDNKVFALIHDIGDRVRRMGELVDARRRAEEADRMKSAFLANMSHEIRTPLNAIVGFAEVLATEEDVEARQEYMEIIRTNSDLLLQLINDILDLSRIESGKYEMNFQQTEILTLLHEVEQSQRLKIDPGIEFVLERPEGEEIWVTTDRNRVKQVLLNFLSNAIKHTDSGRITLRAEKEDTLLRFSVIDTGRGIPAERLATIFRRFEKINDFVQGTGLGLAISESLVERLGGHIGVESEEGKGSTFWFTIPYRNDPDFIPGGDEPLTEQTPQRKKILLAEESENNYFFVRDVLLDAYDADILWARNGEEAVNAFVLEKPDLILMCIQMPVMGGIEATRKIRAISPSVPIIAITANAFYMEQQWALESGCNEILSKPYSASKIKETVLAFL